METNEDAVRELISLGNNERYLKLQDLIEILLLNVECGEAKIDQIVNVLVAMVDVDERVDEAHIEKTVSILFDHDKAEVLFTTTDLLN